ncbi:MAG: phosphate ABC transporter permease subunit PstC [Nitratireductor sp.]|nr:phosphate ABC transporter permease subunit PstC [Nitratireductor sp.]
MSAFNIILTVSAIALAGYVLGIRRARKAAGGNLSRLHSLPGYAGAYVLIGSALPALLLLAAWLVSAPILVENSVRSTFPDSVRAEGGATENLAMGMVHSIGDGLRLLSDRERTQLTAGFVQLRPMLADKGIALASSGEDYMVVAAQKLVQLQDSSRFWMTIAVLAVSLLGAVLALSRIALRFRARNSVERVMLGALIAASTIAILTTVGIFLSMVSETGRFFASVPPMEFFFGTVWDPRFAAADDPNAAGQFGLIPLLAGTLYIALVAMLVAVPIGLYAAIYMAEYASKRLRATAKPLLEVLAGIPTIVYGFFALVTIGPLFRDFSAQIAGLATGSYHNFIQAQSVLTAGFVMGIMLIPFVSSLSDDIITQVPRAMRDGSLGLGATRSETVRRVILPAALPGIVGALLLTASRAIGETMIVVLAAGVAARLSINPFEPMTTVTVKIVNQLTGDLEFTSPQTLVAFALGISLFFITLGLNVYALYVVRKYREQYE